MLHKVHGILLQDKKAFEVRQRSYRFQIDQQRVTLQTKSLEQNCI